MTQHINLDNFDLIIFGDFGVTTNTPFKDHAPLAMLPGRAEYLAWVQEDRRQRGLPTLSYSIAANKGGVAWGIQSEEEAEAEVAWTAEQIDAKHYDVCYACERTKAGFECYATPEMLARRKPAPAMFRGLAELLKIPAERVLIIDHYQDGFRASKELGMAWQAPGMFFRDVEAYITTATSTPGSEELVPLVFPDFDFEAEEGE